MALTAARNTASRMQGMLASYLMNASTKIYGGSLVVCDTDGYARVGVNTTNYICLGRAEETLDNTGIDGAKRLDVREGVFKWANSGSAAVAQAHVGRVCYIEDDQTVTSTAGNGVIAGTVVEVETDGVWVATFRGMTGAGFAGYLPSGAIETVTSGALDPGKRTTLVSCTGTVAYTLADGTIEGQRKTIRVIVAASTPDGTLTPATFADGTSIDLDAVNEEVELEYHASGGWRVVHIAGATIT